MIANAKKMRQSAASARAAKFLALLPQIREQARFAFRGEGGELREELIAEAIANCWVAFVRLVERGLIDAVYATPLAQYAIKQVCDGRRVGCRLNVRDVSSEYAQQAKRFTVERLDRYDIEEGEWREVLIEDRKAGPADTAAARMDIADWFNSLPRHKRRIAETLASSETTKATARKFRVSPGRISQTRRELETAWQEFQGESAHLMADADSNRPRAIHEDQIYSPSLERLCMHDSIRGLFGLVMAIIASAFCITVVTGSYSHWPVVLLGIGMGLWAVRTMSKS